MAESRRFVGRYASKRRLSVIVSLGAILVWLLTMIAFATVDPPAARPFPPSPWDENARSYGEGNVYLVEFDTTDGTIVGLTIHRPPDDWINPDAGEGSTDPVPDVPERHAIVDVTEDAELGDFLNDFAMPNSHEWKINVTSHALELDT